MSSSASSSLYYSDGKSDKEYHAQLEPAEGGYVVNFQYGRRGSALRSGTKTASPVNYEKAKTIYDKLVAQKMAKGYSPGEEGVTFQSTDLEARKTGVIPQLLNSISEEELFTYIENNDFILQEKFDGERRLVQLKDNNVIGINRKGLSISLPAALADSILESGETNCVLDGEALGDRIIVFDVLEDSSGCLRDKPYSKRLTSLKRICTAIESDMIKMVATASTTKQKQSLLSNVKKQTGEGVVVKNKTAAYKAGRPNKLGNQLKYKFVESASVIVIEISDNKRSVSMSVLDKGKQVNVGKVTIKANQDIPKIGDILEVQYLYAYKGGSLFQPVCLGVRTDLDINDCVITQLKYKPD